MNDHKFAMLRTAVYLKRAVTPGQSYMPEQH